MISGDGLYDLALFERLNDEWEDHPISPRSRGKAKERDNLPAVGPERARLRNRDKAERIAGKVDLAERDVLELGCGYGWLTAALAEQGAASVVGVDILRRDTWANLTDDRVSFVAGDLSAEQVVPPDSVDVVVSDVVFEHIARPLQMLAALHRTLRDDGVCWLHFNLWRGRNASHRYTEINFPWPHLLFDEQVSRDFYAKHHGKPRGWAFVNEMTVAHYLHASREAGWTITRVELAATPIDVDFYRRFQDRLGRYPALDLETNFMSMWLTKGGVEGDMPSYLERQRALDEALVA